MCLHDGKSVRGQRGFTVMELMVVLIIIAIVMKVATPAFRDLRLSLAHEQSSWQVLQDLRAARQLAVTRHHQVIVAFGNGIATSNITQYTVHSDLNNDKMVQAGELVVTNNLPAASRLSSVTLNPVDTLIFDMSGVLKSGTRGGRVVVQTPNSHSTNDTILVSIAGLPYKP